MEEADTINEVVRRKHFLLPKKGHEKKSTTNRTSSCPESYTKCDVPYWSDNFFDVRVHGFICDKVCLPT